MKQRANQLAFGHSYGKSKSNSDAQIARAENRLTETLARRASGSRVKKTGGR